MSFKRKKNKSNEFGIATKRRHSLFNFSTPSLPRTTSMASSLSSTSQRRYSAALMLGSLDDLSDENICREWLSCRCRWCYFTRIQRQRFSLLPVVDNLTSGCFAVHVEGLETRGFAFETSSSSTPSLFISTYIYIYIYVLRYPLFLYIIENKLFREGVTNFYQVESKKQCCV